MTELEPIVADPHLAGLLQDALGDLGFVPIAPLREMATDEAAVSNGSITVHVDPDCARVIMAACHGLPAHRMLIPRHVGLDAEDVIALAARYVRLQNVPTGKE